MSFNYEKQEKYELYTEKSGKTYVKIKNYPALARTLRKKFGDNWKLHVIKTYGPEQLGFIR